MYFSYTSVSSDLDHSLDTCIYNSFLDLIVDGSIHVLQKHLVFLMPPDRMIGGILFLSCLSACLSHQDLTLAITFEL